MRGLLPLARLARSIVRASSMSSTVWLIWRSKGSPSLHAAPWPALRPVREVRADDDGEAFAVAGNTLAFLDQGNLWTLSLPDGEPVKVRTQRLPDGSGPSLAASAEGALAIVMLTSLSIDLMIAAAAEED